MINGAPPRNTSGAGPRAAATPLRHGNTIIPSPKPRNSFSATLKTLKTQRAARYSFVVECCCASIAIVARGALQELQARICFWIGSFFFESNVARCRLFPFCAGSGRADGVCALQIGPHKSSTQPRKPVKSLIVLDNFRLFSLRAFPKDHTCSPPQKYQAQLLRVRTHCTSTEAFRFP